MNQDSAESTAHPANRALPPAKARSLAELDTTFQAWLGERVEAQALYKGAKD